MVPKPLPVQLQLDSGASLQLLALLQPAVDSSIMQAAAYCWPKLFHGKCHVSYELLSLLGSLFLHGLQSFVDPPTHPLTHPPTHLKTYSPTHLTPSSTCTAGDRDPEHFCTHRALGGPGGGAGVRPVLLVPALLPAHLGPGGSCAAAGGHHAV